MKLLVVIAFVLLASSVSGSFFKRKKSAKVIDIHIEKGNTGIAPGQAPVGQVPLGPIPVLELPYDQLPYGFVPINQVQIGHVRVGHGSLKQPGPVTKTPVPIPPIGQAPVRLPLGQGSYNVPVLSQHSIQLVPVQLNAPLNLQPQLVSVEPTVQAVQLLFKSASSPLLVRQRHFGSQGSTFQVSRSEDQPHLLRHEVHKPVLQEVREIIQPYRSVTQEIKPVLEQVHTLVPKGQYGGHFVHHPQVPFQQVRFPGNHNRFQQPPISQEPISQEPISQEPISQEPISQEPISQDPVKGFQK